MKKSKSGSFSGRKVGFALAAVALVAGSFYFTSGNGFTGANSLLAAVVSTISGKPTIIIGRSSESPKGAISHGRQTLLAVYDVSAKNVTNWATMRGLSVQAVISSNTVSPIELSNISMKYSYCISSGQVYGYGWKSKGCATTTIAPSAITRNGPNYIVTFGKDIVIYPEQHGGSISIFGTPKYQYTGTATKSSSGDAKLQVVLSQVSGVGDKCTYGYISKGKYGYTKCYSSSAVINIRAGKGNTLTVNRPYGYGYHARTTVPTIKKI
jgi:hypothetical protein